MHLHPQRPQLHPYFLLISKNKKHRVQTPSSVSKRNIIYSTREPKPHLELAQGEDQQTIHSTILKDDEFLLFPNFPNHSNPHTPPIFVNLLRSPTKVKLIEMGTSVPMVYEGLLNPLTAHTPYLPSYLTREENMTP